ISSADLGPMLGPEPRQQLRTLLDDNNKMALEYECYATLFYDAQMPEDQRNLTNFDKAMEVYSWINHSLHWRRGWQRVTLDPNAYRAFLSALDVFPDLLQLYLKSDVDKSGRAVNLPRNPTSRCA